MNKSVFILALVATIGLVHADLRSEILAARQKQENAAKAKDVKAAEATLRAFMTPDFKYVQGKEVQDAKTFIGNYTSSIAMMDKISASSTKILSLKETGNTATGKVELHMVGTMKNPDKKVHTMDWTGIFNEEYRKVGGKWKTAKMIAGPQKFLMDGKPVKM